MGDSSWSATKERKTESMGRRRAKPLLEVKFRVFSVTYDPRLSLKS